MCQAFVQHWRFSKTDARMQFWILRARSGANLTFAHVPHLSRAASRRRRFVRFHPSVCSLYRFWPCTVLLAAVWGFISSCVIIGHGIAGGIVRSGRLAQFPSATASPTRWRGRVIPTNENQPTFSNTFHSGCDMACVLVLFFGWFRQTSFRTYPTLDTDGDLAKR